ncbi:MAG: hypothetical protein ACYDHU_04640 [Acidimicrobiales bacterium]
MSPTAAPARRVQQGRVRRSEEVPSAPAIRPPLRVVDRREGRRGARRAAPRRLSMVVALGMVVASLVAVVSGHAMLAQGQIRLAGVQSAISGAQNVQRQDVLTVSMLEAPSRIVGEAQKQLHMTSPTQVVQLPAVSLSSPLPTPSVAPTPTGTAPSTAATSAGAQPAYSPATPSSASVPGG